jgi:hypothetical protein
VNFSPCRCKGGLATFRVIRAEGSADAKLRQNPSQFAMRSTISRLLMHAWIMMLTGEARVVKGYKVERLVVDSLSRSVPAVSLFLCS